MFAQNRPDNVGTQLYKPIGHFYVDSHAPSLHANNSEIGAKTVNIKMIHPVITLTNQTAYSNMSEFKDFGWKGSYARSSGCRG